MKNHWQGAAYKTFGRPILAVFAGMILLLSGCGGQRTVQPVPSPVISISMSSAEPTIIPESTPGITISDSELKALVADMVCDSWEKREEAGLILKTVDDKARVAGEIVAALEEVKFNENMTYEEDRSLRNMVDDVFDLLEELGAPSVEPLLTLLNHEDSFIRASAFQALQSIGDERAVEPLISLLQDTSYIDRTGAVNALGNIGDERAVEPLIAALKDEKEDVRATAAYALGEIGDVRAVEPLILALKDESKDLRVCAVSALGKIGGDRAAEVLSDAYFSRELKIEYKYIIDALAATKNELAVNALTDVFNDTVRFGPDYRYHAFLGIVETGGTRATGALFTIIKDESSDYRYEAVKALADTSDVQIQAYFDAALDSEDLVVIAGACEYFVRLGKDGSEEIMITAMYQYSDAGMAVCFLNCGNSRLEETARTWLETNGYTVYETMGETADVIVWGQRK